MDHKLKLPNDFTNTARIIFTAQYPHFSMASALSLLLILFAALYILLVITNFQDDFYRSVAGPSKMKVCGSEACKWTADRILKSMNQSVDPCHNFYQFVCGNFLNHAQLSPDKTQNSSFTQVQELVDNQLRSMFLQPPTQSLQDPAPFRIIEQLYQLCMDEKKIDERGVSHAVRLLEVAGGWPVLSADWSEEGWSADTAELNIRTTLNTNGGSLFRVGISTDAKNTSRRVIEVDQPELELQREFLLRGDDDKVVRAYRSYMVDLAVLYGADTTAAQQQFTDCLQFELELAKIMVPREERRDFERMYNMYTLSELNSKVDWVDWRMLLNNLLPFPVPDDEPIVVDEPDYLVNLGVLLQKYPKRVVANYMMWHSASALSGLLVSEMRDRRQTYKKEVIGQAARQPRWEECINTLSSLTVAIGSTYVTRFFDPFSKKEAASIAERIRQEMYLDLQEIQWMDVKTKEHAMKKVSSIVQHIGYPDELTNTYNLEQFYSGLTINEDNFFEAIMDVRRWYKAYRFGLLRQPVDKKDWRTHSNVVDVNAFYNPVENSMQFPAAILQPPFFSSDLPKYVNYGTLGLVMAHEITHGFDDEGSQFDFKGNLKQWWDNESKRSFIEKKKCIINQYGSFEEIQTHLRLNGITTQGENVADVAGLKLSYRAYRRLQLTEALLPGLTRFTQDQLLMISMANMWCTRYRPEALSYLITTGVHSPSEFRVNGILMNIPQFSKLFHCGPYDFMNPPEKCSVW